MADLDSIQNSGSNFDLISKLLNTFQHLTFLIDNGFDYPKSVKTFCEKLKKKIFITSFQLLEQKT